jgi:hypothetical protein
MLSPHISDPMTVDSAAEDLNSTPFEIFQSSRCAVVVVDLRLRRSRSHAHGTLFMLQV